MYTCVWLEPIYEERLLADRGFRRRYFRHAVYALVECFQLSIGSRRIRNRDVHIRFYERLPRQKKILVAMRRKVSGLTSGEFTLALF